MKEFELVVFVITSLVSDLQILDIWFGTVKK